MAYHEQITAFAGSTLTTLTTAATAFTTTTFITTLTAKLFTIRALALLAF
jgi:hypothetical protein